VGRPGFPKTLREFQRTFADEAACVHYLPQFPIRPQPREGR
jgi:hypothetical protein